METVRCALQRRSMSEIEAVAESRLLCVSRASATTSWFYTVPTKMNGVILTGSMDVRTYVRHEMYREQTEGLDLEAPIFA